MAGAATRAVVVGAGMAGLMAARALADVVDEVVILEREVLGGPTPRGVPVAARGHIPQGRHIHVLLLSGLDQLNTWFPGMTEELVGRGGVPVDGSGVWFHQFGGYRVQGDVGGTLVTMTRPLVEEAVRERVRALPNVRLQDGVRVDGLVLAGGPGTRHVTGVLVDGVHQPADLVVDCSGRSSRLVHQLRESGDLVPPVTRVELDIGYSTRFLRRRADDVDGTMLICGVSPPDNFRSGAALPVEGDRWHLTLGGMHGDLPPTDEAGYLAYARSLASPAIAQLLEHCEPLTPPAAYRYPSAQRRHVERVHSLPGLVLLGDSACSFDPIYGQGMSSAALQARALAEVVGRRGVTDPELATAYHRRAAKVIDAPWSIALGADLVHPATVADRPRGSSLANAWTTRVIHASHTSLPVNRAFNDVLNLVAPAATLVRPDVVARVLVAARRSPAVGGPEQRQPVVGPAST